MACRPFRFKLMLLLVSSVSRDIHHRRSELPTAPWGLLRCRTELALARLKRGADRECTILMISLDYLPAIKIALGHLVADAGLRFFAALLRNELRDVDLAGRFDGEKIAVLLPESDQAAAAVFAKRLRHKVAETSINVGDNQLLMTFNIGIAAIRGNDTTGSQALMRANQALIQKKLRQIQLRLRRKIAIRERGAMPNKAKWHPVQTKADKSVMPLSHR